MSNKRLVTIAAVEAVLNDEDISVCRNKISGKTEISGIDVSDDDYEGIRDLAGYVKDLLEAKQIKAPYRDVVDFINYIALSNSYNPVQEMLDETTRDGEDHISDLLGRVMGLEGKPDQADLVKRWLHQTLALAFNGDSNSSGHDSVDTADNVGGHDDPDNGVRDDESCDSDDDGCEFLKEFDGGRDLYGADGLLVLVGEEGCGKTLLLSKLAVDEDLFCEGAVLKVHNKDNVTENTSYWITELCDVDNFTSGQSNFITKAYDRYHPRHGRNGRNVLGAEVAIDKPRRTSFCATANRLPKPTKTTKELDRRLWIVDASKFDLDRIQALDEEWFKQLWKQVYEELYLPNPEGFYSSEATTDTADAAIGQ